MAGKVQTHFTEEQMDKIAQMALDNCKTKTIAEAMDIPYNTLKRHLGKFMIKKRAEGKAVLYRQQKQKCEKGDTTMLIWRGKQDLEQADKHELTGKDGAALVPPQIIIKPERAEDA